MTSEAFMLAACIELGLEELNLDAALIRIRELRAASAIFTAFARHLERHPRAEIVIGIDGTADASYFCELYDPETDDAVQMTHGVTAQDAAAQLATVLRLGES